jgi:hypothetical protein
METLSWDNQAILEMFRKSGVRPGKSEGLTAQRARWCLLRIWNLRPTKKICVERQKAGARVAAKSSEKEAFTATTPEKRSQS